MGLDPINRNIVERNYRTTFLYLSIASCLLVGVSLLFPDGIAQKILCLLGAFFGLFAFSVGIAYSKFQKSLCSQTIKIELGAVRRPTQTQPDTALKETKKRIIRLN